MQTLWAVELGSECKPEAGAKEKAGLQRMKKRQRRYAMAFWLWMGEEAGVGRVEEG